tara:strand:+ start:733 stop:1125 length:393 start_codon:yes stop_codon:yes gene_type:complete
MKQQPKDTRVGLTDDNITKIREWLISQGKNPDKKKSEFIRFLIDSFNSDKVYFNHKQLEQLQLDFENLVRLGSNFNQLMYHINIEHIEFLKGNENDYVLNAEAFSERLEEINKVLIELKLDIKKLASERQ